jgi:hypothetical protein
MNWKLKATLCSAEKSKLMKATLVAGGKENAGAVLRVKSLYLAIKKGWKGLHQDYPGCFRSHSDPDHQAQGCAG